MNEGIDPRIQNLSNASRPQPASPLARSNPSGAAKSFADTLSEAAGAAGAGEVRFSNHAQKRLETRSIILGDDGLARLANAVDQAGQRGGKESLVLMDDLAFIVNVRDRLVVTAVDLENRGQGVFTQIDSVVIAESSRTRTA